MSRARRPMGSLSIPLHSADCTAHTVSGTCWPDSGPQTIPGARPTIPTFAILKAADFVLGLLVFALGTHLARKIQLHFCSNTRERTRVSFSYSCEHAVLQLLGKYGRAQTTAHLPLARAPAHAQREGAKYIAEQRNERQSVL